MGFGGCLCVQLCCSLPLSVPQFLQVVLLVLGPLHAGSHGPADQHLPNAWVLHCPATVSAPGQAHRVGTCQLEPAQVWVPACPGVFLLPPDVLGARRWVAQLCREGRSKMGAVSQRKPVCLSSHASPGPPSAPWSLVWWCVALLRKPCQSPARLHLRPPPRPYSWRFQFCISAAQGELSQRERNSVAPTVALAPPPRHPLMSPRSWQGQQPLLQHLQRQLCHSDLPWSVAQRAWRGFPAPLPKSRGWIWFCAGTLVRQCPCKVTWWSRGVTPHNSYPALIWGYLHPIPVRASEELQRSHSARCGRLCPWHSWLVPLFLVIAHRCTVMLGSRASPATGGGFPPPCSHLSPFPHPWCCAAVT